MNLSRNELSDSLLPYLTWF